MEEFKGTKGPWVADKTSRSIGPISRDDDQSYGMLLPVAFVVFDPEIEIQASNKNIIAAAPELLEALQQCEYWLNIHASPGSAESFCVEEARAAIAKALGK